MIKHNLKNILPEYIYNCAASQYLQWRREMEWYFSVKRWISVQRLGTFKNKYRGERCFIVGNGPSLNKMDLSRLGNEYTFGLNRIYLMFTKLGFSTTFFVSVNPSVLEQCTEDISKLRIPKFLGWAGRKWVTFDNETCFLRSSDLMLDFSKDPVRCIHEGATVTYVAMQLAYYMGFKQVILVGVDHNFTTKGDPHKTVVATGDDPNHFDKNYFGKGFRWQLPDLETSERAYSLAREIYNFSGRNILDATKGGKLQVFPKVSFESLFQG